VAADKLRRARIILLKATHIPIVGVIWLFESVHGQVNGGASNFSSIGPDLTQLTIDSATTRRKQRPFLSNRTNTKTLSQHFIEMPSEDGSRSPGPQNYAIKGKKEGEAETVLVGNADLAVKIEDLTAKIAELTSLIMARQGVHDDL